MALIYQAKLRARLDIAGKLRGPFAKFFIVAGPLLMLRA